MERNPRGLRIANSFTSCSPGMIRACFEPTYRDGNAERVVDLKGFRFTGSVGYWFGLDPADTPMLIRDVGTDDIYALTLDKK